MRVSRFTVLAASLFLLSAVAGCPRAGTVSSKGGANGKPGSGEANADDLLKSAVLQLRPEVYSIASTNDKPVSLLNSWRARVAETSNSAAEVPQSAASEFPSGWIAATDIGRLKEPSYDVRDAVHIRDSMMTHVIAMYLQARSTDEVARIQVVFDFVVRNVALRGEDEPDLPVSIYQLLLHGRGTAEDRAWICAAILKQLRIDSVIIRPTGEAGAEATWLFGVLLNGHIYLFDTRLGIAIPSTGDIGPLGPPASLEEIASHPEWLQSLAIRADQPYTIDADALKHPAIQPIVDTEFWSRRMRQLESALPADDVCVLYDPPFDEAGRSGMLARLQKAASGAKPEQLKPWPYPRQRFEAEKKLNAETNRELLIAQRTFGLPYPIVDDPATEGKTKIRGNPERRMLRIRTDQLLGKFEDVTKRYLPIRQLELNEQELAGYYQQAVQLGLPAEKLQEQAQLWQELAQLNRLGVEDAIYWSAASKFEAREYEAAIEQLNTYLKRYVDRNGRWRFAARALLAECHAELGHFAEAAAALERARPEDPYRAANAIRIKRWNARK